MPAERVHAFDRLRVMATVGVVLLHGGAGIVGARRGEQTGFFTSLNAANVYDSAGRFAVGCFFMISAALLLAPERPFDVVRQTRKVLVPLVVWSFVYIAYAVWTSTSGRSTPVNGSIGDPDVAAPVQILRDALAAPVAYHLWFVYVLVGLYLVVPLLRPLTARPTAERRGLLLYGVSILLGLELLARFVPQVWPGTPRLYVSFLDVFPSGFVGVFLLGFLLYHHPPRVPAAVPALVATGGFAWIVVAVWRQQSAEVPSLWAYENLNLPVLLFSAGVFTFVTRPAARLRPATRAVGVVSALSYRIYLVHALVLHVVRTEGPTGDLYQDSPVVGIPVAVAVTLVVSFAIAWLLGRVRPLRSVW
ncbi:acyltransferase family protein [Cytobacillus oceanisediminis]